MRTRAVTLAVITALLAASAVSPAAGKAPPKLKRFASCRALVAYAQKHAKTERRSSAGPERGAPAPSDDAEGPGAEPAAGEGDGGSSGTNVQEADIDEPDLVKSKGARIFALAGGALQVVGTGQDEPRLLDTLKIDGFGQQLLVRGDRALVIGYQNYWGGAEPIEDGVAAGAPYYSEPKTTLTEVDISDASDLRVVRTETIDGLYVSARMTDDTARVVVSSVPRALAEPAMADEPAGWRPKARVVNRKTGRKRTRPLAGCRSIRRPKVFSGLNNLTVLTINMSKGLPGVDADTILTDGQLIYGSRRNLYVATQRWVEAPGSPEEEPPKLSSAIHKFDASEPGRTSYVASGTVRGTLLSQWSFSDHQGTLRVATTDTPIWWNAAEPPESESFVTTFREAGDRLEQVGQVGGIGRGERIYAVRFIGDVGYVVTFRQVDPLHTLDLSDPEKPRVAGELKVRGYSAYLHPLGGDLLLGVGQDATEQGAALGTQLSLFDVGDPAHPVRLHHRVVEGGSSEVEYDHHAFLWWGPAKLAVLPVQVWDYKEGGGDRFFGAIGFHVERGDGIDEAGRATHAEDGNYDGRILRSLVVDGRLFTLSNRGVELNDLATLEREAWVPFPAP